MFARTQPFRVLLRPTTSPLRLSKTQLSKAKAYSQIARRPPSPPPPYQVRGVTILAPTTQWTRFSTPYSFSSVRTFNSSRTSQAPNETLAGPSISHSSIRTFTSSRVLQAPSETLPGSSTSPEAAKRIDEVIEDIQELYGTARDEFEIAAEETEKNTTYAADDRAAAREELDSLLEYYNGIIEGPDKAVAEEVKRRVGQRIRELEQAVIALEESVKHGD